MTRRSLAAQATAVALLAATLGACNGSGGISIPTNIPTTLPTSITLPTLPTQTETQTETQTRTQTETRTVTVTPTRTTSTTTPVTPASESTVPTWVWVLLAILVIALIALIWWLVRRTRIRAQWDERFAAARQHASWVEDSLVPQVVSRATTTEAAAVWASAGQRLLATDEELHDLALNAPDQERAGQADDLRGRLGALTEAVGADTASGADDRVDDLRARRAAIQRARNDLRAVLNATAHR